MLVFVVGGCGSGKTTLVERIADNYDECGCVEVGKEMRKRYSPEAFQGQGCPDWAEREAWNLMVEKINEQRRQGRRYIFIDGQPRKPRTVDQLAEFYQGDLRFLNDGSEYTYDIPLVLHLYADYDVRHQRIMERDRANDKDLNLAKQRLENDTYQLYDVLSHCMHHFLTEQLRTDIGRTIYQLVEESLVVARTEEDVHLELG